MRIYKRIAAVVFATALLSGAAFYSVSETNIKTPQEACAAGFSDLIFTEGDDHESAAVQSCNKDASGFLEIPPKYADVPVRYIRSRAFSNCENLTEIYIPDSVSFIEDSVFSGASGLRRMEIPGSIEFLPEYTFRNCHSLEEVKLNEGLKKIGQNAFAGCRSLKELTIPASVESIDTNLILDCSSLETLTFLNPDCMISGLGTKPRMVRGYAGSTAERYARGSGLSFEPIDGIPADPVFCDASGDGEVTALDAQYVLEYYLESMLGNDPSWKEITGNQNAPS